MHNHGTAAVIGGGLGGLSAAAMLASSGYKVTLFEKNEYIGGKAAVVSGGGYTFDAGPSLLTMPFILENLFIACGEKASDFIALMKLENICKYFYPDGTVLNAYSERSKFKTEVRLKTGEPEESIEKYLLYCQGIYDTVAELFIMNDFRSPKLFFSRAGLRALMNLNKIDPFRTVHKANASFFNDKRLVQMFDRYATYNGSSPYLAPATLNIIPHVEFTLGAYIPQGGIRQIPEIIRDLALRKGVQIRLGSAVEKITEQNKHVTGVVVSGKFEPFDFVISNADVNYTYEELLSGRGGSEGKRYKTMEPSGSGLVFYWGVAAEFDLFEIHNILFSENYEKEFTELFTQKILPSDPTVYIYISSKYNKPDAPNGCSNMFVMINTPYDKGTISKDVYSMIREVVLHKIKRMTGVDILPLIKFEQILTPANIESNTMSKWGSIYGISSNSRNAAFLRQANRAKNIKNLYFCGGSAHPGGGIPLVIQSGMLAAQKVIEDSGDML